MDLLGGSRIMQFGRYLNRRIKETAGRSIFFGRVRKEKTAEQTPLIRALNRIHPVEKAVTQLGNSRILGWLYHYWGNLCSGSISSLLWLLLPLLGLLAVRMAVATRFALAGGLLLTMALSVFLFGRKEPLADWMSSSLLGRRLTRTGTPCRSVQVYLLAAGVLGGAVGSVAGVLLGGVVAVGLAVFPIVFSVPAIWVAYLLFALLPLLGTSLCWGLSLVMAVCYFFGRAFGAQKGKPLDRMDLLMAVFPAFCVVSALFSFDRMDSVKVIFMWLGLFACIPLLRRIVDRRSRLNGCLWALTAGALVSGLYGLYQYFSGMVDTTWTDTSMFQELELRVYSTFANPNVYGEFLLIAIPLLAGFALYLKGWKQWILWGVELLLLVNMALTYSRGCYVGIALTALVFLWHFSKKWTVAALVLGVPAAILAMPESVATRILSIGNMNDTSTSYRMKIYIGTLAMLTHYWLGGVGIGEGAFNSIYPYYAMNGVTAFHSHSLFFQSAVSFGIVGVVYLLWVWTSYQRRIDGVRKNASPKDRPMLLGFSAVFWGLMVQSVFDYTWYNYRVFQLFWMVIALGLAAAELLKGEERK